MAKVVSYNLTVLDETNDIKFDSKREGIKGDPIPEPQAYSPEDKLVARKNVDPQTLKPVKYVVKFLDEAGTAYEKSEVKWKLDGRVVTPANMTTVFKIVGYAPLADYTDMFNIHDHQELVPDEGTEKNTDRERDDIRYTNLSGMKRLWEKLYSEELIAKGAFNASTGSMKPGVGFLRAILIDNKWTLELGVCREKKIFKHLQEREIARPIARPNTEVVSSLL